MNQSISIEFTIDYLAANIEMIDNIKNILFGFFWRGIFEQQFSNLEMSSIVFAPGESENRQPVGRDCAEICNWVFGHW